jgi:hypothetical protein
LIDSIVILSSGNDHCCDLLLRDVDGVVDAGAQQGSMIEEIRLLGVSQWLPRIAAARCSPRASARASRSRLLSTSRWRMRVVATSSRWHREASDARCRSGTSRCRKLVQYGGRGIRALCVITWNEDAIRPWVSAVRPTVLGDRSAWEDLTPELDPVVAEAIKSLTLTVNHNNTISAGFEKDMVVSSLLALHDAGIRMDGEAMQGWTLANGHRQLAGTAWST